MKYALKLLLISILLIKTLFSNDCLNKPNFLIIMVDDISPSEFGCYGNNKYPTPNIDKLANGGIFFNMAWATPMCSPTRALLVTGRYPSKTGVWHNDLRIPSEALNHKLNNYSRWSWAEGHMTFARLLRENGYITAIVGKQMALGHHEPDSMYVGFDEYFLHINENRKLPKDEEFKGKFEGKWKFPGSLPVPSRFWYPAITNNGNLLRTNENDFAPDLYTDYLVDFIERNKNKPFLAYFPMNLVHDIAGGGLPTIPKNSSPGSNKGGDIEELNAYVDKLVGRIIEALNVNGLREKTIIIFTSDNGTSGASKMHATEEGPRVPLIINCPGIVKPVGETNALMEFADIFPTILDYSNTALPEDYEIDGLSMRPLLEGTTKKYRDTIISYIATARMARSDDWLLEAVDPIYGSEQGRLYKCNGLFEKKGYTLISDLSEPNAKKAYNLLMDALSRNPWPDLEDNNVLEEVINYDSMPYKHYLEKHQKLGPQKLH